MDSDFDVALENIIDTCDDRLRKISSDRAALAYAAFVLSQDYSTGSNSFPFVCVTDGIAVLLNDLRNVDYYEIKINREIPAEAKHLIVYNRRFRLPENVYPDKIYWGEANLPNGSYELHRDLKGGAFLIVPKAAPKDKLNVIPFNESTKFSLKISYKASELAAENQNGEYVTRLMAGSKITFSETTMNGNKQYCVYAGDVWVGTVFDDQAHNWVLRKEVIKTLIGKKYSFVGIPHTGIKVNSNSFTTGNGKPRTAQVLTFIQLTRKALMT
jgi:hypothetical protein